MKCLHIRFMSRKAATIKNEKKKKIAKGTPQKHDRHYLPTLNFQTYSM